EELAHASGEFHLVRKNNVSGKKASQQSDITIIDDNELESMRELGLIEDDSSLVNQGMQTDKASMQDQATSPITEENINNDVQDNSENQNNTNIENDTASQARSSRQTSPKISREKDKVQGLLQELSTPVKGEVVDTNNEEDEEPD
ncbi:33386_t:CDS:1, partial [Gigaspora margarita]